MFVNVSLHAMKLEVVWPKKKKKKKSEALSSVIEYWYIISVNWLVLVQYDEEGREYWEYR